jgi:hypothetical protein
MIGSACVVVDGSVSLSCLKARVMSGLFVCPLLERRFSMHAFWHEATSSMKYGQFSEKFARVSA